MEWALLQGEPTGVSVFFIDAGIDTGRQMFIRKEIPVLGQGGISQAKNYLFSLDAEFYKEALQKIRDENFSCRENDGPGRRYYVMSKLFLSVTEDILAC